MTKAKTLLLDQTNGRTRKRQEKILNHQRNLLHSKNPRKDVPMDARENIVDETANVEEHPDSEAAPKTNNAPKNNWFKQPLRYGYAKITRKIKIRQT
ncbi:hypothetical protein Tco_1202986 [Tanacetum coccineum]